MRPTARGGRSRQARAWRTGGGQALAVSRSDAVTAHPLDRRDHLGSGTPSDRRKGASVGPAVGELQTLYQEQSPRLLRVLARRGANEDAPDLIHEIFLRLARLGSGSVPEIKRPGAYLNRMATNLLRDRAKLAVRRAEHLHIAAEDQDLIGPDPHRLLESRDMLRRLEVAVSKLKPRTREVFLAHRLDGLSYAEIAQRTGLSVKGVEKQMSKAIAQIDRMVER